MVSNETKNSLQKQTIMFTVYVLNIFLINYIKKMRLIVCPLSFNYFLLIIN